MINKISNVEMDMITEWRYKYALSGEVWHSRSDFELSERVLCAWKDAKNEYLYKMFGEELILSKDIEFGRPEHELANEMYEMMYEGKCYGRDEKSGTPFVRAFECFLNKLNLNFNQSVALNSLVNSGFLVENKYPYDNFTYEFPDGRSIKVQKGAKITKILGKIAADFNFEGYEDFRICHSQILNQKKLKGRLSISIHPLDYMTMSDNTYGWDSCMSWSEYGAYRQGTVEMMNSPMVVVAYLSGDQHMNIGDGKWNSKKWRQLFVVDKDVIASVKAYPYFCEDLTKLTLGWLKELAEKNLGWGLTDIDVMPYDNEDTVHLDYLPEGYQDFYPLFSTEKGYMYNDFGSAKKHFAVYSKNIDPNIFIEGYKDKNFLRVNYCGLSQCMVCGNTTSDFENDDCLACFDCQGKLRCDHCGEYSDGCLEEIDGISICPDCYENVVKECALCGEDHLKDRMTQIVILPEISKDLNKKLKEDWIERNSMFPWMMRDIDSEDFKLTFDTTWMISIYVCEDEVEEWMKRYLKEGRPHLRNLDWNTETCVYFNQINEDCIKDFLKDQFFDEYDLDEITNELFIEKCKDYARVCETKFYEFI